MTVWRQDRFPWKNTIIIILRCFAPRLCKDKLQIRKQMASASRPGTLGGLAHHNRAISVLLREDEDPLNYLIFSNNTWTRGSCFTTCWSVERYACTRYQHSDYHIVVVVSSRDALRSTIQLLLFFIQLFLWGTSKQLPIYILTFILNTSFTDYSFAFTYCLFIARLFTPWAAWGIFFCPHFTFLAISQWRVWLTAWNIAYHERNIDATYVQNLVVLASEITSQWRHEVQAMGRNPIFSGLSKPSFRARPRNNTTFSSGIQLIKMIRNALQALWVCKLTMLSTNWSWTYHLTWHHCDVI